MAGDGSGRRAVLLGAGGEGRAGQRAFACRPASGGPWGDVRRDWGAEGGPLSSKAGSGAPAGCAPYVQGVPGKLGNVASPRPCAAQGQSWEWLAFGVLLEVGVLGTPWAVVTRMLSGGPS